MESGSTVTCSSWSTGKGKLPKRQKANEDEDMINKLPESLISHILSFLPTEDAVRTCILSKRWMYHWTTITKLDLDDSVFYSPKKKKTVGKQYFVNLVNRALLLTKASSTESFSLVIANKYDVSLVNTWISSILNRNIKNLRIDSHWQLPFSALASRSLFKSYFLEELVLSMCCPIKVPTNHVCFVHLKLLKLSGIIFTIDSNSNCLRLSLPALKKFETINCIWSSIKSVIIEAFILESICIQQDHKSVSHEPRSCAIWFSGLLLTEFTYCGYGISQHITLSDPSMMHTASANIILHQCENRVPETGSRAFWLLKQFNQVKSLKFDGSEVLTQPKVADLSVFGMLSHLELGLVTAEVLLGMLLKSPVLKTLLVKGISKFDKEKLNSAIVPDCFTSTLQAVKFGNVHGSDHELYLAKFVMENGIVLERMSFSLVSHWLGKSKVMEEFKEKLFSFKKGFSFAIVEFTYDD